MNNSGNVYAASRTTEHDIQTIEYHRWHSHLQMIASFTQQKWARNAPESLLPVQLDLDKKLIVNVICLHFLYLTNTQYKPNYNATSMENSQI